MPYIGNITQDFNVNNAMLDTDSVTSIKIVDGTIEGADIAANLDLSDTQKIRLGAGNDLQIYHDGSNSYLSNTTGNLNIYADGLQGRTSNDEYTFKAIANGAVELYYDNVKKFETYANGVEAQGNIITDSGNISVLNDTGKFSAGTSEDLNIYHNGTDSIIDNNTNNLEIITQNSMLFKIADAELAIVCNKHGGVDLYHDNSKKFETKSTGVIVSNQGNNRILDVHHTNGDNAYIAFLDQNTTDNSIVRLGAIANEMTIFSGGSEVLRLTSNRDVNIPTDGKKLQLGASQDLQIYHDSSNSRIADTGTGALKLSGNGVHIENAALNETLARFYEDGAVELYYDNSKKFETTSAGNQIFGNLVCGTVTLSGGGVQIQDSDKFIAGNGDDLQIYHDGANSLIDDAGTGILGLRSDTGINLYKKSNNEFMLKAIPDGAVELYHDNTERLKTNNSGIEISSALGIANVGGTLAGSGGSENWMGIKDSSGNFKFIVKTHGTNNGFVGIGETAPLAQLHIKPASNVKQLLLEQNNATDGYALFQDGPNGGHLKFMRHINGSDTQTLLLRSGGGLCFGTDSAAANALDDYEEGTFTPVLNNAGSFSSSAHTGTYTRVGRLVHYIIQISGTCSGTGSGTFTVSGLPFTANNSTGGHGQAGCMGALFRWNIPDTAYQIGTRVSDNSANIQFFANFDNANDAQLTSPFNAGTIFGSLAGSYFTS